MQTIDTKLLRSAIPFLIETVHAAGSATLTVYDSVISVEYKNDRSPVTAADRISHAIILERLTRQFPFPILSEEGRDIPFQERRRWDTFWLVDPLDGTKEFINRNGEFTVNIALIHMRQPVLGVIYVPVTNILYHASAGSGSYRTMNSRTVRLPDRECQGLGVIGSRSHATCEFTEYVESLRSQYKNVSLVSAGSSLKFCMVAEGSAHIYPRLGPTMEWDTAAGQAILEEAGGRVVMAGSSDQLLYNKQNLVNPNFIATGKEVS